MYKESDRLTFLYYAFVCARKKLDSGKMTRERFEELEEAVRNNTAPSVHLLEHCFPKAFEESLSFRTAAEYWHQHKGSSDPCSVRTATICSINDDGSVTVLCGNKTFEVWNRYKLPLDGVVSVFIHWDTITEVEF